VNICNTTTPIIIDIPNICNSCCSCKEYLSNPTPPQKTCYYFSTTDDLLGVDGCGLTSGLYNYTHSNTTYTYFNLILTPNECNCVTFNLTPVGYTGCGDNISFLDEDRLIYKDGDSLYKVHENDYGYKKTDDVVCTIINGCSGITGISGIVLYLPERWLLVLDCIYGHGIIMEENECYSLISGFYVRYFGDSGLCNVTPGLYYLDNCIVYNLDVCFNITKCITSCPNPPNNMFDDTLKSLKYYNMITYK